jgi:hypothetical protein
MGGSLPQRHLGASGREALYRRLGDRAEWQGKRVSNVRSSVLKSLDAQTTGALTRLLPQASSTAAPLTGERIREVLASPSTHIMIDRSTHRHLHLVTCGGARHDLASAG